MTASLSDRLEDLLAPCGEQLVSARARTRLAALAAQLEPSLRELAVECHLGRGADAVDLTARVFPAQRDRMLREPQLPHRVRRFFEAWARSGSDLGHLPFVELEWDHHREGGDPWIGPAIEPLVRRGIEAIEAAKGDAPAAQWPCYRAASALITELGQRDPVWHARMLTCFERLPRYGCINHLSLLEIRGDGRAPGLRMIGVIPRPELQSYLGDVGWSGELASFEVLLARYAPHTGAVGLDLDVHLDHAAPRVAFYLEFRPPRDTSSALRELIAKLEQDGLAPDGTADALRSWIAACRGRQDRALTFKLLSEAGARRVKVYFSALDALP